MVLLCFKKIILGKITYQNNKILYTSYKKGEDDFKKAYPMLSAYGLFDSNKSVLDPMPDFLQEILLTANHEFYKKLAKINQSDTNFKKLEKLAEINWAQDGFYITTKTNFDK